MRVPALALSSGDVITQSLAIIEYLDDIHPEPPLLPADALERAHVRAIAQTVACDIHPLNNLVVLQYLKNTLKHEQAEIDAWYHHWVIAGFKAIEAMISPCALRLRRACDAGRPLPGAAGVQCAPAQGSARRLPEDRGGRAACLKLAAFDKARPENQPDAE